MWLSALGLGKMTALPGGVFNWHISVRKQRSRLCQVQALWICRLIAATESLLSLSTNTKNSVNELTRVPA